MVKDLTKIQLRVDVMGPCPMAEQTMAESRSGRTNRCLVYLSSSFGIRTLNSRETNKATE